MHLPEQMCHEVVKHFSANDCNPMGPTNETSLPNPPNHGIIQFRLAARKCCTTGSALA